MSRQGRIRRAVPTRESASGPGDRIASTREVAAFFRDDCRTLRDSLQLEMVVAQYLLQMRDSLTPEGVAVGAAISAGVVAELERHGDPLSHAILRGVAHLGTGETATRGAEAAALVGERGVGLPPSFADVGTARPLGAWRDTRGANPGEFALFAEFEYPSGAAHSIALFVEALGGGTVKHIGLLGPMAGVERGEPFHPDDLETLEVAAAAAVLREVLDRSFGRLLAGTDDYRVLIAAARARCV
jgi:hypothetical protein